MFADTKNIIISTGNILHINRKAGQKTSEELFDCLKLTLNEPVSNEKNAQILRLNDDLTAKITEHERSNIKIGAKIFVNRACPKNLESAIDGLLDVLGVESLDNLILAFHPSKTVEVPNGNVNGRLHNGNHPGEEPSVASIYATSVPTERSIEWGGHSIKAALIDLKKLWKVLENYSAQKKITQLGIADLDTDSLINLYTTASVRPTIVQINLSACCVVPPPLQEFCNKNDIQLLTHSDPEEVISSTAFNEIGSDLVAAFIPTWTARYQVHVKCRGVLTAKGFIVGAEQD